MISIEARAIVKSCWNGACLQKSLMFAAGSRNVETIFYLRPGGGRVPVKAARQAIESGWLTPLDPGLFDDRMLAQSWVFKARPAAGKCLGPPSGVTQMLQKFSIKVDPKRLIAKLDAEIDRISDDKNALSAEARALAAAKIQTELLEVERQESAAVWTAQQQNLPCEHRADCAPTAILGLALRTVPVSGRRGTSLEHAMDLIGVLG